MNRTLPAFNLFMGLCLVAVMILSLSGCADTPQSTPTSPNGTTVAEQIKYDNGLAATELPDVLSTQSDLATCPYLDADWVASTNGQRVASQGIDTRFTIPACVFWSYAQQPQVTVIIRQMPTKAEAYQVVDWAAPIDSTDPVEEAGWSGGRGVSETGSVYAVSKDTIAVVVFSDQRQSIKAQLIAHEAIAKLNL